MHIMRLINVCDISEFSVVHVTLNLVITWRISVSITRSLLYLARCF